MMLPPSFPHLPPFSSIRTPQHRSNYYSFSLPLQSRVASLCLCCLWVSQHTGSVLNLQLQLPPHFGGYQPGQKGTKHSNKKKIELQSPPAEGLSTDLIWTLYSNSSKVTTEGNSQQQPGPPERKGSPAFPETRRGPPACCPLGTCVH